MTQQQLFEANRYLWPNFQFFEIDCNCEQCGHELWNANVYGDEMPPYFIEAMMKLQALRNAWGEPLIINSGHRCESHNDNVGGASQSKHLDVAFDIRMPKHFQEKFKQLAFEYGFNGIGTYSSFIHLDCLRNNFKHWSG